jgi:predicted lipoprotein with Yx(FWY)xxD motif
MGKQPERAADSRRRLRYSIVLTVAVAGFAVAALAGIAGATTNSSTVNVSKNVKVGGHKDSILANSKGVTVYYLSPETEHHVLCTPSQCWGFWPPVKVASAHAKLTKAAGVKGKLGIWHHHGIFQVTWNGHPMYTFANDHGKKGVANGNLIQGFGGTWHVVVVKSGSSTTTTTSSSSSSTTSSYSYPY